MKWKKLGMLLDLQDHKINHGFSEFAQSPQALVFDKYVRIYFSTRTKDSTGKYLSKIVYIDVDKKLKNIIGYSKDEVIPLGELGTFDEHGIFPFSPTRVGEKIYAYTCGWSRRVSVSVETSTGLALSDDNGSTFKKIGSGPIFSSALNEPFLVGDSFVRIYDDTFHMWYIYGTKWTDDEVSERVYKIAHAISDDGINWVRDSKPIIKNVLGDDECQALPTVIYANGIYNMIFCFRDAYGFRSDASRGYRLGYAWSKDLINWNRDDTNIGITFSDNGWDSTMMCYPHLFEVDGNVYLLYNGNEFGRRGFGLAILEK